MIIYYRNFILDLKFPIANTKKKRKQILIIIYIVIKIFFIIMIFRRMTREIRRIFNKKKKINK